MHARHIVPILAVAVTALACEKKQTAADSAAISPMARTPQCVEGGGTPTITAAGVGPVRVGARLSTISDRCTMRDSTFSLGEGQTENGRVVGFGTSSAALIVNGDVDPVIERVIVADSSIRTDAGIGVGKTVGAMRAAYGRLCAATGEGRTIVGVPPLPGVSFGTSAARQPGVDVVATPEAIPDTARVTGIWVYGGRAACGGS